MSDSPEVIDLYDSDGASIDQDEGSSKNASPASSAPEGDEEEGEEEMAGCTDSESSFNFCEDVFKECDEVPKLHEFLQADIRMANSRLRKVEEMIGVPAVQLDDSLETSPAFCSVVLNIDLSMIQERIRQLWELDFSYLAVVVDRVYRGPFRLAPRLPTVHARKGIDQPSVFTSGEQLRNFSMDLIKSGYILPSNELMNPAEYGSFFKHLYDELSKRLMSLADFCIVCNQKLQQPGLLPSICDRELCTYQYNELGLYDGLLVPRVSADVMDLLFAFFFIANSSSRRELILTPEPPIRDMDKLKAEVMRLEGYNRAGRYANWMAVPVKGEASKVKELLGSMALLLPCPRHLLDPPANWRDFREKNKNIASFIDWLVVTCRAYIHRLPQQLQISFANTPYQYMCVADSPAKQATFERHKAANGGKTVFLFHGSPIDNWHSIIRNGLQVLSNTKLMINAAAYGAGIYLAYDPNLSIQYSQAKTHAFTSNGKACSDDCCKQRLPLNSTCTIALSLVEVVNAPQKLKEVSARHICVLTDPEYCSIRMLFLYERSPQLRNGIQPSDEAEINTVLEKFKTANVEERINIAV